jgi:hypothetical protein
MEMIVGVGIPILLLAFYEIKFRLSPSENLAYEKYLALEPVRKHATLEDELQTNADNRHSIKVIALGVLFIGVLIIIIGFKTIQSGWLILITGLLVLGLGIAMKPGKKIMNKR